MLHVPVVRIVGAYIHTIHTRAGRIVPIVGVIVYTCTGCTGCDDYRGGYFHHRIYTAGGL
jgi:hypothetical protein